MSIATALRLLTEYMDGVNPDGAREAAEHLKKLNVPRTPKAAADSHLDMVIKYEMSKQQIKKKPKLSVRTLDSGRLVEATLDFGRLGTVVRTARIEGDHLTATELRNATERCIRAAFVGLRTSSGGDR